MGLGSGTVRIETTNLFIGHRGKVHGFGGEGAEHLALKEYVASHPNVVSAKESGLTEHIILSGDRVDIWFPESQIAVEIKPETSSDSDILRGLFQCVKYKATLDAEAAIIGEKSYLL